MTWLDPSVEATRLGSRHVQVFIPSVDRDQKPVPQGQQYWVEECLRVLGKLFGGATAFPPARGVWRDDQTGALIYDDTVIVFSYASPSDLTASNGQELRQFVRRLGREANQGEVGVFVDGQYHGFTDFEAEES